MFGLRRHQTYDELVGEIDKPLLNVYPDRKASQLRSSIWLSQLDGDGAKSIQQQQLSAMKEQHKQNILREYAMSTGQSHAQVIAQATTPEQSFYDASDRPSHLPQHESGGPIHYNLFGQDDMPSPPSLIAGLVPTQRDYNDLHAGFGQLDAQQQLLQHASQIQELGATTAELQHYLRNLPAVTLADREHIQQIEHSLMEHSGQLEQVRQRQARHAELLPELTDAVTELIRAGGASSSSSGPVPLPTEPEPIEDYPEPELPTGDSEQEANYQKALSHGKPKVSYRSEAEWKGAFAFSRGEYVQQMWLRKLKTKANTSIDVMVKKLIKFDEAQSEAVSGYRAITSNRRDYSWRQNRNN